MQADLTSTPDDLLACEAATLSRQFALRDGVATDPVSVATSSPAMKLCAAGAIPVAMDATSLLSPCQHTRLDALKIEPPLTPHDISSPPAKRQRTVAWPEDFNSMIPGGAISDANSDVFEATVDELDAILVKGIAPKAECAAEFSTYERLSELDTTLRVEVPDVEQVELKRPWQAYEEDRTGDSSRLVRNHMLAWVEHELKRQDWKWSGLTKLERSLTWSPFPTRLGKSSLVNNLDEGSNGQYLKDLALKGDCSAQSLLCGSNALRILQGDPDDEELEAQDSDDPEVNEEKRTEQDSRASPRTDLAPLSHGAESPCIPPDIRTKPLDMSAWSKMQMLLHERKSKLLAVKQGTLSRPESGIGGLEQGNVSRFMTLHGHCDPALNAQTSTAPEHQLQPPAAVMVDPTDSAPGADVSYDCPMPLIGHQTIQGTVVVSSSMLSHAQLVRSIQSSVPDVDLVERGPAEGSCKSLVEADATVCPSTGLILTTLQKLKQRPLPGQKDFFGIQEKLTTLAPRYERLVLLVSEGKAQVLQDRFDERDAKALANIMAHAASVQTAVEVYYVAGGETSLARWVAALICRHASSEQGFKLNQDETQWERFLRLAGLNAFAAQAILASLERQHSNMCTPSTEPRNPATPSHALATFVQMPEQERLQVFEPMMGGARVLTRVSRRLDRLWESAAGTG